MERSTGRSQRERAAGAALVHALQVHGEQRCAASSAPEQDDEQDRGRHQKRSGRTSATTK